tara:strand:- start:155 stop:565 length:411 start_codon:yes stop_codon:yes gene_type:complete
MELTFKFLDKELWSIHGTMRTMIPFLILYFLKMELDLSTLILISLTGMMKSKDLIAKILFTGFLCFMIMNSDKEWILKSIIITLSVIISHNIKYKNKINRMILKNSEQKWLFRITVLVWMIKIMYLILNKWRVIIK